jgi:hypothetical protein
VIDTALADGCQISFNRDDGYSKLQLLAYGGSTTAVASGTPATTDQLSIFADDGDTGSVFSTPGNGFFGVATNTPQYTFVAKGTNTNTLNYDGTNLSVSPTAVANDNGSIVLTPSTGGAKLNLTGVNPFGFADINIPSGSSKELRFRNTGSGGLWTHIGGGGTGENYLSVNLANSDVTPSALFEMGGLSDDATDLMVISTSTGGTSSSTALRMKANGWFGLATSSPGSVFAVGSVANFGFATSTFYSSGGINLQSGCFSIAGVCIGASAASSTLLANNNTFSGANTFSQPLSLTSITGTTTIASGQGFTIGSTQFVLQQGSGNVGIGTVTPQQLLDVTATNSGGTGAIVQLSNLSSTLGSTVEFRFAPSTASGRYSSIQGINADGSNDMALAFLVGAGSSITEKMRITSNGKVGIATTSPGEKLDVNGNAFIEGGNGIILQDTATGKCAKWVMTNGALASSSVSCE